MFCSQEVTQGLFQHPARDREVEIGGKFRQGAEIPLTEGILLATYTTLRSPARQGKASRLDQIVA